MNTEACRRFWDEKAREEPYWYISSYGRYGAERNLDEFWASGRHIWEVLKRALHYTPRPTDCVVEIGCGIGRLTRAIAAEVGHVDAFDISAEMIARARQHELPNTVHHVAEGFSISALNDSTADAVIAYCVFQHLPHPGALKSYLAEMARVARPGGLVAFTLCAHTWLDYLMPLMRTRTWMRERFMSRSGPKGLYKREWSGIRPTRRQIRNISPFPMQCTTAFDGQWLLWGRKPTGE